LQGKIVTSNNFPQISNIYVNVRVFPSKLFGFSILRNQMQKVLPFVIVLHFAKDSMVKGILFAVRFEVSVSTFRNGDSYVETCAGL